MDYFFATTYAQETSFHDPTQFRLTPHERSGNMLVLAARSEEQRHVMALQIAQDIKNGAGLAIIDTTGHFAHQALDLIPPHRAHKTLYFKPENKGRVVGFNPFRAVSDDDKALVANRVVEAFVDIWGLDFDRTPLLIDTLRNTTRLVLDADRPSFLSMYGVLTNEIYRKAMVEQCSDAMIKRIWEDFERMPKRDRQGETKSTLTRIRAFLADPLTKNVLCQPDAPLDLDRVVNSNQIFIANLNRRAVGAENARLLGSLLLTRLQTALANKWSGWPFYVYVPAAQEIHVGIVGRMLSERFHHGGVIAGLDQIADLDPKLRTNMLAAERILSFRCPLKDVEHFVGRLRVPRAEDNVPALAPDKFVMTEMPVALTAPDLGPLETFKQAKQIQKRSSKALGERKRVVENKANSFIEALKVPGS